MKPVERAQRTPFARRRQLEECGNGGRKIESGGGDADEQTEKYRTVAGVGMIHDRFILGPRSNSVAFEMRVDLVRAMVIGRVVVGMDVHQRR